MVIKHLAMSGAHRITFDVLSRSVPCRWDGPLTVTVSATVVVYRMQLYSRRELTGIRDNRTNNVRFHASREVRRVFFPGHRYTKGEIAVIKQIIKEIE